LESRSHSLLPAAGIPWLYFAFAHVCLAAAFAILTLQPSLPGSFFLHPRMAALVHLVTLGWITSSIFGAFYFVAPLTMRMPLRPRWADRIAFGCYAAGVIAAVMQFWNGDYERMAQAAALVLIAALLVSGRAVLGLPAALGGWPVKLHVALAFGLAVQRAALVSAASGVMFVGVVLNAAQLAWTYRRSRESGDRWHV
jgi:hypothetical protein